MEPSREDAESTVKSAILDGISRTAHVTGLTAGSASEQLRNAIYADLMSPSIRWAFAKLAEES